MSRLAVLRTAAYDNEVPFGDAVAVLVLVTGLQGTGKSTIAERCADMLDAPVFAWDWVMAAMTPFERLRETLEALDRPTYRAVGWAVMWQLSRAQLQRGRSVVLDGLARADEVTQTRSLAGEHGVECLVVLTTCDDPDLQRTRVEGRTRGIPGWYELTWDHVAETRRSWQPPADVDVELDCGDSIEDNVAVLQRTIRSRQPH
jgi:predicted kinase